MPSITEDAAWYQSIWQTTGKLAGEPGGMELGKHVTTRRLSPEPGGRMLAEWRREENPGYILEIRLRAGAALPGEP